MSKPIVKQKCSKCGAEKENRFCNSCKTDTPNVIYLSVSDKFIIRDNLQLRRFPAGMKKFISEFLGGWFPSRDSRLLDGVDKIRIIDREKNEYHEIVKKHGTEEITHERHEPLDQHKNQ